MQNRILNYSTTKKRGTLFCAVLCLSMAASTQAQELLTVEKAIEIGLKNNYDIILARNQAEIAERNNTVGNAGMLPRVNGVVSDNATYTNLNQEFQSGNQINTNNVVGNNLNAAVNLNWTLFDGLKMFATKSKLKRLAQIGEFAFKQEMQDAVSRIIIGYYDIVRTQQQMRATDEAIRIAEERVKIANAKFEVGNSSKVDLLQAKVDLNAAKSSQLAQRTLIVQKKANLSLSLALKPDTEFTVSDSIAIVYNPALTPADLDTKNFTLQAALKNVEVARFAKKEFAAQYFPTLTALGGYSYNRSQSTAGFLLYSQTYGLNGGFNLNIPLFNGLNTTRQVKIAGIEVLNQQVQLQKTRAQINAGYYNALKDFENAKAVLMLEEDNILLAQENVQIALERFRLAQSTSIELRQAEQSYVAALVRVSDARYSTKLAETELMRLQGELVK